ncbi:MAG: LytTR family transcriptional regulator DNA-binding domain-containing protein, partial [Flavobacterium sp.]
MTLVFINDDFIIEAFIYSLYWRKKNSITRVSHQYINEIIYIEYFDRKTIIHKKNEKIATYLTLKEWMSLLGNYHFCH